MLIGTPPIAWLVLAPLWFGAGDGTRIFTAFVACVPIIFVGALQGARTLDGQLSDMATAFRVPPLMRCCDVYLPHVISYVFPALLRATMAVPEANGSGLLVAAMLCWITAFTLYAIRLWPVLTRPRTDGQTGCAGSAE